MEDKSIDFKTVNDKKTLVTQNSISQRSELAQEVIASKPDFLERWALIFFMIVLFFLAGGTWIIKYPDFIQSKAVLTSDLAPKEIVAKQGGRIVRLFTDNDQPVVKYQMIGWLESTANHEQVITLSKQLDRAISSLPDAYPKIISQLFNRNLNDLGEIQPDYQQFIDELQQYDDYLVNGFYTEKRESILSDIADLNKTADIIKGQKTLTEQDLKLAEESFKMSKTLLDQKVLTKEEFRAQTSRYVNKELALPQLNASLISNETSIREKMKEINQLDHDLNQEKLQFGQILRSFKSKVDDWIKKYTLQAAISGNVSFIVPLQENQYIQAGKILGYINPSDGHHYVECNLSQHNFGKIDTGMAVQLRFDAYPYQEVGFVEGKISYISKVPSDSGFLATVKLNKHLLTNTGKLIVYKNGLKAEAIIITRNMRLSDRLYYDIVKSLSIGKK